MSFWNRFDNPFSDVPPKPEGHEPAPAAAPAPAEPPAAPAPAPAAHAASVAPVVAPPPPRAESVPATPLPDPGLRLGRGVRLEGKLTFSGAVRVDATFQGEIVTDGVLVVGADAKVDARITCGTVIVEGAVNGDVTATAAVELRSTARLHGDVETPSLSVDRGAIFEGASRRSRGAGSSSDRRAGKAAAAPAPSAG
jgi:cytoskeletal protein CcmA (bactofilin family)